MRRHLDTVLAALVVVLLVAGGFALGRSTGRGDTPAATSGCPTPQTPTGSAPAAPGAADVGFAQDMAVHHEQAVSMATLALTRSTGSVRAVAESILGVQSQEVGLLRGWLRLWGAPGVDPTPMAWMGMTPMPDTGVGVSTMPGMASPGDLQRLYRLRGRRFDVAFLQLMIRHHEGGLIMAHAALQDATLPAVRTGARSIVVEQVEDLGVMRALLRSDDARPLPPPT